MELKIMNKKMYNITPLTQTQTDLQGFKAFKTTVKCDIQQTRRKRGDWAGFSLPTFEQTARFFSIS